MNTKTLQALSNVLDYLSRDERKHYEEAGCPTGHIYEDIVKLQEFELEMQKPHEIKIIIEGGCLRDVKNLPEGMTYELIDLD